MSRVTRVSFPTDRLAHLHAYQPGDQDREIELSRDSFCHSYPTGLQSYWSDVAKAYDRKRCQAEVDSNRDSLLLGDGSSGTEAEGIHRRDKMQDACPTMVQELDREPGSFWFLRTALGKAV
jgi:hypothetical protein